MPNYQVLSTDGDKKTVLFTADDGYQETQVYVGDADVLSAATINFNQERLKSQLPPEEPTPDAQVEVSDPDAAELISALGGVGGLGGGAGIAVSP